MSRKRRKLVRGWGVNDVDYDITRTEVINGENIKVWICPYYRRWCNVLGRCFDPKYQARQPTYKGCTVCEEWRYLSNFIKWVDSQPNRDWINCHLDKDFIVEGNKHYSPETCVFIAKNINSFIVHGSGSRGDYMVGVSYLPAYSKKNPYRSMCKNPFTGKQEYLGHYPTELEAHFAWKNKKHEHALVLANTQPDERIVRRLCEMYSPDKDWTNK